MSENEATILGKKSGKKEDPGERMEDFILEQDHPCVMAQSVFGQKQVDFHTYEALGTKETGEKILADLKLYLNSYDFKSNEFFTFIAAFPHEKISSETEFENALWQQLQAIHDVDDRDWDPEVSSDKDSSHFSFSIAGKAFYIVGMHPNSSRKARQSPFPVLVFNLHWQFEQLREMGAYENVRNKIRERDRALQGDNNPMLEDFGSKSEARQYSGKKVTEDWKCPFHHKKQ